MRMQVGRHTPSLGRDSSAENVVCSAERCRTATGLRGKQCKQMDKSVCLLFKLFLTRASLTRSKWQMLCSVFLPVNQTQGVAVINTPQHSSCRSIDIRTMSEVKRGFISVLRKDV